MVYALVATDFMHACRKDTKHLLRVPSITLLEPNVVYECANLVASRTLIGCPEKLYEHVACSCWQREREGL